MISHFSFTKFLPILAIAVPSIVRSLDNNFNHVEGTDRWRNRIVFRDVAQIPMISTLLELFMREEKNESEQSL